MGGSSSSTRAHVAYFSPLPPARSGIADYSRELLPHLAQRLNLTLFTARPKEVDQSLRAQFPIHPLPHYPGQRWQFDVALYQMGNSSLHEEIYQMLVRYGGIVVLHDYFLHHFILDHSIGRDHFSRYSREMGYALGQKGINMAWNGRLGHHPYLLPEQLLPLNNRLIDTSLGLIVHSRYAQERIRQQHPHRPVAVIPELIEPYPATSRRDELGLPADAVIFAVAGQVTATKQVALALRAFGRLRQTMPHVYFLIIGEETAEVDLDSLIGRLKLENAVKRVGFVPHLQQFVDWVATADVILNLRYPTVGETSATALRALAVGRPLIVFDHGWYREIPAAACLQVPPLDEEALLAAMGQLAKSAAQRQEMGRAARHYVITECHPASVAQAYVSFIRYVQDQIRSRYERP